MSTYPFPWLNPSTFYQFSQEVGLNYHCNRCSALPKLHYWDAGIEEGYIPRESSYTSTETGYVNMTESRHIPCIRITCAHCGHIENYSIFAVVQWRERKMQAIPNQPSLFPPANSNG